MMRARRIIPAGVLACLPLATPSSAGAQVNFVTNTIIASGDAVSSGSQVRMDVYDVAHVDLIWRHQNTTARYTQWINSLTPVAGEQFAFGATGHLMGVSHDNGTTSAGVYGTDGKITRYTRVDASSWDESFVGLAAPGYLAAPVGAFDVNPQTHRGGFVFKDLSSSNIVLAEENGNGDWTRTTLSSGVNGPGFGVFIDLTYSPQGVPYVAFKTDVPEPDQLRAGPASAPGLVSTSVFSYAHLSLDRAPDGTLYLLDMRHSGDTKLYLSSNNGASWAEAPSFGGTIINAGLTSFGHAYDLAVAPDRSLIAALVYNASEQLVLASSRNGGASWTLQPLPGGGPQVPDAQFDSAGNLYVSYYDAAADALRLLSTFPLAQPGDTDFDGDVDLNDLGNLASAYGTSENGTWRQGDFDLDGDVDLSDLGALATHYGAGAAQAFADFSAVPEPNGAASILGVVPLLAKSRRRRRSLDR